MRAELPSTLEEAKGMTKDYKYSKTELTKAILTTKLKNIHKKCRKLSMLAERVDMTGWSSFFELCEKIWGRSPATTQIQDGVESMDLVEDGSTNACKGTWEPQSEGQLEQSDDDTSFVEVNHDNQKGSNPETG